ncbi:pyrroline-5-carboxylate reductase dimerization domain-containing protein [Streptomyces seoulensis]|uniref:pyrroline-5-carboxylate reductase dimerization domain-containing protein n=1 Tax=Streptomyces seoulensis TaxID=73044 RepID=UPI003D7678F5
MAHLARSFTDFARGAGLDATDAAVLTSQVLRGTAEVPAEPGVTPGSLYRRASTPRGTTAQGIATLREQASSLVWVVTSTCTMRSPRPPRPPRRRIGTGGTGGDGRAGGGTRGVRGRGPTGPGSGR